MVFQKKGATPAKNFQPKGKKGKKPVAADDDDDSDMFNDMNDSDDFDSDDDMPVQKTPQGKTPKGRQSLSEKKVTFDMSAKNTPNKTPNKNNSLVMKKTPTPAKGKGALQEFKGIKGGKPQQKKGQAADDDDDDDDDDEEDDSDMDEDVELDSDDDLDDEADEDEDDDDDNDDDDEEEEQKPKQNQANKQKKQKTPIKNKNAKNQSPKDKTPKKEPVCPKKEAGSPQKNSVAQSVELERRTERNSRMLHIGGLPKDVNTDELKSLSPDIISIIIPKSNSKNLPYVFGFLCFTSEAKAEANFKSLQNKKFRGQSLKIDFVGEKSKNKPKAPVEESTYNERKLYVTGIPDDATIAEVAVHFPKAYKICFNKSPSFRSASIFYAEIEDATAAFESKKSEIRGSKLFVVHSNESTRNKKNKRKFPKKNKKNANANQGGNAAKKMKFTKQEESDDDEE